MDRIKELEVNITNAATAYYTGQSIMTDSQFDTLVDELRELDPNNVLLRTPGWGYNPEGQKSYHKFGFVGSLEKYRTISSVLQWSPYADSYVDMPKYDGISCKLYYNGCKLVRAVTRGNGTYGINITEKIKTILGNTTLKPHVVLQFVKSLDKEFAIRGELCMSKDNWQKFSDKYPEYKNSRNAVAGIINSKLDDRVIPQLSYIDFVPYKLHGKTEDLNIGSNSVWDMAQNFHINMDESQPMCYAKLVEFFPTIDQLKLIVNNCQYPCDGIVHTVNNFQTHDEDGNIDYTQIAFKFEDEKTESRVDHLEWNLTRTGKLVPVACIDPVELDGATIRRVTCFNAKYVKVNRIGTDAIIELQRSGMVIPDIQRVIEESPIFELPTKCPKCGAELKWSGTDLICDNPECSDKNYRTLHTWINNVAGVKGISWNGTDDLIDILGVTTINDIYNMTKDEANERLDAAAVGYSTREKYMQMIEYLYGPIDPCHFLIGLNLKGIGWNVATSIVNSPAFDMITVSHTDNQSDASEIETELYRIPGIGYNTVVTILNNLGFIRSIASKIRFDRTQIIEEHSEVNSETHKYCITGAMNYGSRSQFSEYVKQFGWEMVDIKNAEYLVTNNPDPTSSKGRKAKELGINIITEDQFLTMIKGE